MIFLYAAAIFFTIILVHELGHFIFAKAFGVRVIEFGIGFPPRLFKFKIGDTLYSLNLLLFGAFLRLPGREDKSPRGLFGKAPSARALIGFSGPLFNFLLAFLLFFVSFLFPLRVITGGEGIKVIGVKEGSPAYIAGIKEGDVILKVEGEEVRDMEELRRRIKEMSGEEISLLLRRGDEEVEVRLTPRENPPPGEGPMGVVITWERVFWEEKRYGVLDALRMGSSLIGRTPWMLKDFFLHALREPERAFIGPVGAAHLAYEAAGLGAGSFLRLMGALSFGLGLFNLFPLPPLDGGGIFVALFEGVRRRAISERTERLIYTMGTLFLIAFILLVTYNDILRLIRGERFLP